MFDNLKERLHQLQRKAESMEQMLKSFAMDILKKNEQRDEWNQWNQQWKQAWITQDPNAKKEELDKIRDEVSVTRRMTAIQ